MELNKYFDHTMLKADAKRVDIDRLIEEAKKYNFFSVCINPCHVEYAKQKLTETDVKVCTVIGFPLGANKTDTKVFETECAVRDGADEIDMVLNIGRFKDGDYDFVKRDIAKVKKACDNRILKVIIETALLTDDEIKIASKLVEEAGADFVKTSTGFLGRGASIHDIDLMKEAVGDIIKIKASGGISNKKDALNLIEHGAARLGASKSTAIINE